MYDVLIIHQVPGAELFTLLTPLRVLGGFLGFFVCVCGLFSFFNNLVREILFSSFDRRGNGAQKWSHDC